MQRAWQIFCSALCTIRFVSEFCHHFEINSTRRRSLRMKENILKKSILTIIIVLLSCSGEPPLQLEERYFDTYEHKSQDLIVSIMCPSMGSIRAIMGLREQNFFPTDHITVVGAYHEKEVTNYERSKTFVQENGLDWFKFHKIIGELNKGNLFQKNACTADFEKIFENSDGIILFGGADIPPETYGLKTDLLTRIRTPFRHYVELSLIFHLLGGYQDDLFSAFLESSPDFPVLGLCLGEQTMNVGTGGTLIQDVWSEEYGKTYLEDVVLLGRENWHSNPLSRLYPQERLMGYNLHPIKFVEKGKFISVLGFLTADQPYIISAHHQAVKKLGKGMKIAATTMDGRVVEAIEHEKYPHVLGLQFHPEFPMLWDENRKFRIKPEDDEKSASTILREHPPSYEFHKKIWSWFSDNIKQYNAR